MSKRVISSRVRRFSLALGLALAALWSLGGTWMTTTTAMLGRMWRSCHLERPLVIATVGKPAAVGVDRL
jgi:hypothetical protein